MVKREEYLQKLAMWKDEQVIKVITGIRRCGKSTLMEQYQSYLIECGVEDNQIIAVNFEDLDYEDLLDYKNLYNFLKEKINPSQKNYIFLDEIQRVDSYEKVVDSLYTKDYVDIYITGSNSYLLSGDLATLLTGRYVEIKMLPLSFREFKELSELDTQAAFAEYMRVGGLPYVAQMDRSNEKVSMYLEGIYNTVIVRDIEERQSRREGNSGVKKISDIALLKSIAKFLASVVGSPVSIKSVTDYLVSSGRKISPNTVDDYVDALKEAFVFYDAERIDVVGKELLKTNHKYYMVDMGLRNHILPRKHYDLGFTIENIVYFELLRRGYQVYVGKIGDKEIDFVAKKQDEYSYIQVTADLTSADTFEREIRPLKLVKDNYTKMILTLDRYSVGNYDGIKVVNVIDWLCT